MAVVKRTWNILSSILVLIIVLIAVALVGVRIIGLQVFAVLSPSMEPTYQVGSLIYVKKVDYQELEVGDPITFLLDEDTVATHRIVEIVPDEADPELLRFRTKGDNNNVVDGKLVHYMNVLGKPIFSIPKLGYLANYIQNPPGSYIAIAVAAILLVLAFLPELLKKEEPVKKKKED